MSLIRSFATVSFFTAISRVLGFVRDILIASFLGAGPLADAFFVAFKLPNFLRRLFGEGAFNAAFVPMFSGMLAADGKERAQRFAHESFTALALTLTLLTLLAEWGMPLLVSLIAPGFRDDPQQLALTAELSRITFPYLMLISLAAMMTGMLNSMDRFGPGAAAPIMLNIVLISMLLFANPYFPSTAHTLAWGVALAGIVQMGWLYFSCMRAGSAPMLVRPKFTKDIRRLLILMGPVAVGAGVAQVNLLVDIMLASTMTNAVSYLYFADRVNQLPLGMIGVAIGTALLPALSRHWRQKLHSEAITMQNRALELGFIFCLPATAAFMVLAHPIVVTLFEHGAFTHAHALATAPTLIAYAAGLPALIAAKVFIAAFFATQDTKTPVIIGTICLVTNVILNLILMQYLAHVGLALATSIAGWLNAFLMWYTLRRRGLFTMDAQLIARTMKILLASAIMAAALWGLYQLWQDVFTQNALLAQRITYLSLLVFSGGGCYAGVILLTGAARVHEVKQMLRRKK